METLTTILHELRNEQRRAYDANATRDDVAIEPNHQRNRNEEIPSIGGQLNRVPNNGVGTQTLRECAHEGRDQFHNGRILRSCSRGAIEQERDQVAARDPSRALELEGQVWRLAQIIDEMQGRRKPLSWRIMLAIVLGLISFLAYRVSCRAL